MNSLILAEQGITGNFAPPVTRQQLSPRKTAPNQVSDLYDTNITREVRLFDGGATLAFVTGIYGLFCGGCIGYVQLIIRGVKVTDELYDLILFTALAGVS
jgi:hypothetical protein